MKTLTRQERYLFGLTGSKAKTVAAQRAAIRRAGLFGLTRADVVRTQRENWRRRRQESPRLPAWLLAARPPRDGWAHWLPPGVRAGVVAECSTIRRMAYDQVNWGRLRKRSTGDATPYTARVSETDNGQSGWHRVVWYHADYGCVVSPNRDQIAVSVAANQWRYTRLWRGAFLFEGKRHKIAAPASTRPAPTLRDCCRALQRAGFAAYLTRQTAAEIAAGAGTRHRHMGTLVLCVDFGRDGIYHVEAERRCIRAVQLAAARRAEVREQAELAAIVDRGEAAGCFVCLADSVRAGNCRQGTMTWGTRHSLDPQRHYRAAELLPLANGNLRHVRAAVVVALRRERRELAAGVCELSDHA